MSFSESSNWSTVWKTGIAFGALFFIIGATAGYLDVATHFRFDFISGHFGYFISAMLIGMVLSFISVIGWTRHRGRNARLRAAGIVFAAPWLIALAGYSIDGFNVHGPSALVLYIAVPIAALFALVLLVMAG